MNKKIQKRNLKRKHEELKLKNISLKTAMILWMVLTVLTFFTVILPIIFFRFYKKYKLQKEENETIMKGISEEMETIQ